MGRFPEVVRSLHITTGWGTDRLRITNCKVYAFMNSSFWRPRGKLNPKPHVVISGNPWLKRTDKLPLSWGPWWRVSLGCEDHPAGDNFNTNHHQMNELNARWRYAFDLFLLMASYHRTFVSILRLENSSMSVLDQVDKWNDWTLESRCLDYETWNMKSISSYRMPLRSLWLKLK